MEAFKRQSKFDRIFRGKPKLADCFFILFLMSLYVYDVELIMASHDKHFICRSNMVQQNYTLVITVLIFVK